MSFWTLSTGDKATGEVQDNSFDDTPLPAGVYKAMFESLTLNEWQDKESIAGKLRLTDNNRVLFPKFKVFDDDDKVRDAEIQIFTNLATALGIPMPDSRPTDIWLSKFIDKPIFVRLSKYDFIPKDKPGEENRLRGNKAKEFFDKSYKPPVAGAVKAGTKPLPKPAQSSGGPSGITDEDIPFAPLNWRAV